MDLAVASQDAAGESAGVQVTGAVGQLPVGLRLCERLINRVDDSGLACVAINRRNRRGGGRALRQLAGPMARFIDRFGCDAAVGPWSLAQEKKKKPKGKKNMFEHKRGRLMPTIPDKTKQNKNADYPNDRDTEQRTGQRQRQRTPTPR